MTSGGRGMEFARDKDTTKRGGQTSRKSRVTPVSAGTAVQRILALQSHAGNRAVTEVLRRTGCPERWERPIQRKVDEREKSAEKDRPGRRIELQDQPPELSAEDHVAALPEDSEQEVFLKRGVTPTQRKHLYKEIIRGSFVSLPKILQRPDEDATRPEREHAEGYVSQRRDEETAKLIEFSTDAGIAARFASESRFGYVLTIRIKRKYLTKGATGSEHGWIARQGAPYDIVAIDRTDTLDKETVPLTEDEFRAAVNREEMAEFLLQLQDPVTLAAHMSQFEGAEKKEEAMKIMKYRKDVFEGG